MRAHLRPALAALTLLTLLTGVLYPLAVTGLARLLFPDAAAGSLVRRDGQVVGSALVGQAFSDPRYVWGRPSATGYDASASAGRNLGPTNPALAEAVAARVAALRAADPGNAAPIPVDLVTASASGLDPHVSPASARWQAGRVARATRRPLLLGLGMLAAGSGVVHPLELALDVEDGPVAVVSGLLAGLSLLLVFVPLLVLGLATLRHNPFGVGARVLAALGPVVVLTVLLGVVAPDVASPVLLTGLALVGTSLIGVRTTEAAATQPAAGSVPV